MIYQTANANNYDRVFVVGDLHGCYNQLMEKLAEVNFDKEKDLLISVGDLIDRGEDNIKCLELINESWFKCVKGNHEDLALEAITKPNNTSYLNWTYNGGNWFYDLEEEPELQERAKNLLLKIDEEVPLILEVTLKNGQKVVICHADYPSNQYKLEANVDTFSVVWSRDRLQQGDSSFIKGADYFIFGHTPFKQPIQVSNRFYIDTGAVYNNYLTMLDITDGVKLDNES